MIFFLAAIGYAIYAGITERSVALGTVLGILLGALSMFVAVIVGMLVTDTGSGQLIEVAPLYAIEGTYVNYDGEDFAFVTLEGTSVTAFKVEDVRMHFTTEKPYVQVYAEMLKHPAFYLIGIPTGNRTYELYIPEGGLSINGAKG